MDTTSAETIVAEPPTTHDGRRRSQAESGIERRRSLEKTLSHPKDPIQPSDDEIEYPGKLTVTFILFALCLSVFLVALDQTIIAPALGAITGQFDSVADIGWYGAAYLLTTTATQPLYGSLYKLFSIKWTFLTGVFIFELGSLLTGVAPSSVAFIVGRAIAGIGVGGIFSGGIVILAYTLPLNRRPAAFGLIGGMWGIASVAGPCKLLLEPAHRIGRVEKLTRRSSFPVLGGAFTENLTWRWCFYINLPIGAIAVGVILIFLRINRVDNPGGLTVLQRVKQLDLLGLGILIPAIIALILALQWGGSTYPWNDSRIIGLFVGFGLMVAVFVGIQLWKQDRGTLPPRLFKNRDILCAFLFSFLFGAAFFPMIYWVCKLCPTPFQPKSGAACALADLPFLHAALYFQAIQNDSAVNAGLKLLPLLISCVLASIITGGGITAIGYYNIFILPSMVLFAVGAGFITTWGLDTPLRMWFGYQVIAGLGVGVGFQAGILIVQNMLPLEQVPVATAAVQFFNTLGGAIALAIAQALFNNGLISELEKNAPQINPEIFIRAGAAQIRNILNEMGQPELLDTVLGAYMVGLRNTFYISVATASLAFVVSLGLSWKSVKQDKKKLPDAEATASESNAASGDEKARPQEQ
jgi:MFS family permease